MPARVKPEPEFQLKPFEYAEARALVTELGIAEPIAVTLVRRGHRTVEAARRFLEADEDHDPFGFAAMAEVCERIRAAVAAGRRITVHGDYDVDGVCSTAILVAALRRLGAECDWLIPDRLGDGYGLSASGVEALARRGTELLITVDCGIGSVAEVEAARAAGIEVIVTDHHQPPERLPECPILHPVVSGYPCPDLCAAGVAYKLAAALLGADAVAGELDLVALATVADLVPLRGENRALVRRGLAELRRAARPGIRALLAAASVRPEVLDEGDIAFRLAPRINAAGRLYRADAGVELMLTADEGRATAIAAELERANRERRAVEDRVLAEAEQARAELGEELAGAPGLVVAGSGWHPGVVGIVASRLAERHWRPAVVIAIDDRGRGRGSGRSVPGIDLLAALDGCAEHLLRHGGHSAAAGLEIEAGRIDAFRRQFAARVAAATPEAPTRPPQLVDAVVGGESLGHDVAEQLARLGPFGQGNPEVRLLVAGATVTDVRGMGEDDRHARFSLRSGARLARGVAFGVNGSLAAASEAGPLDLSVRLELNEWNGTVEPRVVLDRVYTPAPADAGENGRKAAAAPAAAAPQRLEAEEFWERFEAELARDLEAWPPPGPGPKDAGEHRRELVDRRGDAVVSAIAALASAGEPVAVVCADAQRRRELVVSAVRPTRFGGAAVAIAAGAGPAAAAREAFESVLDAGSGVVLADWAALARDAALAQRFAHLVVLDPAPFPHLSAVCERAARPGYLHLLTDRAAVEFALAVHADEWPSRDALAFVYRGLRRALAGERDRDGKGDGTDAGELAAPVAREVLCGPGREHPRAPEVAARLARVLAELGLVRWERSGGECRLGVVSSEGTELERSRAFIAYRERYEEGRRFLSGHPQSS